MSTALEGVTFSTTLRIEAWEAPLERGVGVDPRSAYVERFWLPVLGPSTTWLVRGIARELDRAPRGFDLATRDWAGSLGMGARDGRNSPFLRALTRAIDFHVAIERGPATLGFRRLLPLLSPRMLARLPESLRAEHERLTTRSPATAVHQDRGRALALSLHRLGEGPAEIEDQLRRWGYPPEVAGPTAMWALGRPEHSALAGPSGRTRTLDHEDGRDAS